jgi:hypothetical protein
MSPQPSHRPKPDSASIIWVPLVLTLALFALSMTARVQASFVVTSSLRGASAALLLWTGALFLHLRHTQAGRGLDIVLRPQHYIQALVQLSLFAYWGWYWRPVYDMSVLIAAQLLFAYGFSILLTWSRGRRYSLGFGPFPIILSINLFLWFKDDWFYLQFLMIAIGFLGKELIHWNRDGRRVHIFNPSAFSLGLFSLVLIATGATDLTWGPEIASTLTLAPSIYLFLFLVGLVVMYFFSITLVAGVAAATLFALSALYSMWTGVPYFLDSEIPAAVFLGLHLLITDPSTSPKTQLGKGLFGGLYGLGVFGLYAILGAAGAPTFYDKLLCVPLLNLSVRGIDYLVATQGRRVRGLGLPSSWTPARLNLGHMALWIAFFGLISVTGRTDGRHVGDSLPFWETSCVEGRRNACERLLQVKASYCGDNSAWACNELGLHYATGEVVGADQPVATGYFSRACELRFQAACANLLDPGSGRRTVPKPLDLRLLLREGGLNLMQMPESNLFARACAHGWDFACQPQDRPS